MDITDFNMPEKHPFSMLRGYENANEKEGTLVYLLTQNIQQGNFEPVTCNYSHPSMVEDGLLEETGEKTYRLTKKAIGLLYSHYGKE